MTLLYRGYASQAEIDVQYNVAASIADAAACSAGYAVRSRRARETLRCSLDLPYGPTLDETLDIFPADVAGAPVFVFLHGGYWRALSSKEFSCVATGLQQRGITTVVPNYSLCPKVTLDEITRQARAAVAWTLRHIDGHGADPARVALGGHSAGGHLTAMCLNTDWAGDWGLPRDPLAAALPISGIFDIEPLRHSYLQPQIRLDDGLVERNSPLLHVRACATPLLLTWGENETTEFARQAQAFHAAWSAAGNAADLRPVPAAHHLSVIDGLEDPHSMLCDWLAARLGL